MNRGFVPIAIIVAVAVTALVTGGGGYIVYTFTELEKENEQIHASSQQEERDFLVETATATPATTTEETKKAGGADSTAAEAEKSYTPPTPTQQIYTAPTPATHEPEMPDFEVRCPPSIDHIEAGSYVDIKLAIYEASGQSGLDKNYNFTWSKKDLSDEGDKEGRFKIYSAGREDITAVVTRKADGQSQSVTCSVTVEEEEAEPEVAEPTEADEIKAQIVKIDQEILNLKREYLEKKEVIANTANSQVFIDAQNRALLEEYEDKIYKLELDKQQLYLDLDSL